jgi:electron transfer flavoprotein beta subunit
MKLVVCVEQVPDTETRVRVAASGASISEPDVQKWIVSPYDEFAIEEALRIREAKGGEVVVLTAGPERAQAVLRAGLALGADSAVHVKDPALDASDPLGIARALAAAIRTLGAVDLVLCGQQGVGGDHSQVPGLLAELLDLPQVTVAVKIEIGDGQATVEREIEGARETWTTSLPAVISAQKGLNEPRLTKVTGIMAAKKKPIRALDLAALGLDAAAIAARTRVVRLELPPPRAAVRMIEGDPEAQARELVRALHE